jgi:hypothetical protein
MVKLQFRHVFYRICSGALQAAITVIEACRVSLLLLKQLVELRYKSYSGLKNSTANPLKHMAELILSLQAGINLQQISTSRYNSESGTTQAAVIVACRAPLPHKFAADSTSTDHFTTKFLNAENTFLLFKERRPFKFKKNIQRNNGKS